MFFYILGVFLFSVFFIAMLGCLYMSLRKDIRHLSKMVEGKIENKKTHEKTSDQGDIKEDESHVDEDKDGDEDENRDESMIVRKDDQSPTQNWSNSPVQHSMYDPLIGRTSNNISYEDADPIHLPRPLNMIPLSNEFIRKRDAMVVNDPLYPPLNRSSVEPLDNYRLLGYLVGEESVSDSWQLYGRKVNNTRSQFYARPTDRNIDMKIQIEDNMMPPRDRIRDLDNLPDSVVLDHPLFTSGTYKVTENPRTEYNSQYF